MDFKTFSFDVSRAFVSDHRGFIDDEILAKILGWIRSRNLKSLASCSEHFPAALSSRTTFAFLRQVEALFKKNAVFAEPEICEQAARLAFNRAERICRITNRRLDHYFAQRDRLDPDLDKWMTRAEAYINRVLGSEVDGFVEDLPRLIRFTAGATASSSRRNSSPYRKVKLTQRCSPGGRPYLMAMSKFFGYPPVRTISQTYNRVEVVPKNWKTDRTIACEPEGNIPFQLAFDEYAKRRLRKFGIDLSDQTRNQHLAKEGSLTGKYATIDLSMASDTVAYNAVAWLFPRAWFRYLSAFRSSFATGSFGVLKYAKFSSMGNGTTFAVETLIFAACCHAVGSKQFSVYGDDIIIETELASDLARLLKFLGFSFNHEKSFLQGPFRESCGADWHGGYNITPFYLRKWSNLKAQICHNVNGLVSVAIPGGKLWEMLRDLVAEFNLPLVPYNEDTMSGVFIDVRTAYSRRLIKVKHQIPRFRAYKFVDRVLKVQDSRTLFLWYHDKYRIRGRLSKRYLERSRTPAFDVRCTRKWVRWIPPAVGADRKSVV